jgi:hypothetical protein
MMNEAKSRRLFLRKCFSSVLQLALVSSITEGCTSKKNDPLKENGATTSADQCSDYSDLSKDDIAKRENLGYVQKAPSANKQCGNCNLWLPPIGGEACGKCQLFKGPVSASAICTYWAPKIR